MQKIKEIKICQITNGFIVNIGCAELMFSKEDLIKELEKYLDNPEKVEKEYMARFNIVEPISMGDKMQNLTASNIFRANKEF